MNGVNASTGKALGGIDHLRQSIVDILTTPVGSRVLRREYGSDLMALVDAPMNRGTLLQIYVAVADALRRWEPRFQLDSVVAVTAAPGSVTLDMSGTYLPDGRAVNLQGITI